MVTNGNFIFKTLERKDGGEFKNDKGDIINYKPSYLLKVDEVLDNGNIIERKFKIAEKSNFVSSVTNLRPYTEVNIEFSVNIYPSAIKLEPISIKQI